MNSQLRTTFSLLFFLCSCLLQQNHPRLPQPLQFPEGILVDIHKLPFLVWVCPRRLWWAFLCNGNQTAARLVCQVSDCSEQQTGSQKIDKKLLKWCNRRWFVIFFCVPRIWIMRKHVPNADGHSCKDMEKSQETFHQLSFLAVTEHPPRTLCQLPT